LKYHKLFWGICVWLWLMGNMGLQAQHISADTVRLHSGIASLDLGAEVYHQGLGLVVDSIGQWGVYQTHRLEFWLHNQSSDTLHYLLDAGNWAYQTLLMDDLETKAGQRLQTGRFLPISARTYPQHEQYFPLKLAPQQIYRLRLSLREEMAFYQQQKLRIRLLNPAQVQEEQSNILFYQGIFLGILGVMALYNFLIFWAVRDISFWYYVLSITGLGMYFMFYYGFSLEWLWPGCPRWHAYSFAFIVPFSRISWVMFTKTYLNLSHNLPSANKAINYVIYLYLVPPVLGTVALLWGWDLSRLAVDWIGVMGIVVLSAMVVLGILVWREGYRPAAFFLIANIIFSFGSILFIIREVGVFPDTLLTRYSVQIGAVVQVVLFSLGLADRLNSAQQALARQALETERLALEKETERKRLIEEQKVALEQEVAQRTADLNRVVAQLQELNHIKDRFFSIISHDLRSPLATLASFLNILIDYSDNFSADELQLMARKTRQSVNNLSDLLENLLEWALSQMDMSHFEPQQLPLENLVQEIIGLLEVSAQEKNIVVQTHIPEHLSVFADRNMLSFVLRNALVNALKFTDSGGTIQICAQEEGALVWVQIKDNGIGISAEDLDKIFNPQLHFTRRGTQHEKGTGLGLLLCKEFVEKGGGQIILQSDLGKGTTLSFSVPVVRP
jgi:signal transduction histidine kinase